jgi:hypothetical protein
VQVALRSNNRSFSPLLGYSHLPPSLPSTPSTAQVLRHSQDGRIEPYSAGHPLPGRCRCRLGWLPGTLHRARFSRSNSNPPAFSPPVRSTFLRRALTPILQIYLYSNELAERGVRKMEKKNVVFGPDGMKVGVKEVSAEDYADKTQRAFVKTWNAAQDSPSTGHNVRTRRA